MIKWAHEWFLGAKLNLAKDLLQTNWDKMSTPLATFWIIFVTRRRPLWSSFEGVSRFRIKSLILRSISNPENRGSGEKQRMDR